MEEKESNKPFLKNVATLITGTALGQLISFLMIPVLTRLFSPDEYGRFMWFFEFVSIFGTVAALRLELGIVLEKNQSRARRLTEICLKIVLINAVLALGAAVLFSLFNQNFGRVFFHPTWYLLVPLAVISLGFIAVFNSWFTRTENFKFMAKNKFGQSLFSNASQIILGNVKNLNGGLIMGKTVGMGIASLMMFFKFFKTKERKTAKNPEESKSLLREHKAFVYFSTPSALVGTFINFIILDLFLGYYSDDNVGNLGLSKQYIGMAFALFSTSFSQVFYNELTKKNSVKALRNYYSYWLIRLTGIAAIVVTMIFIIPDELVEFILGAKWKNLMPTLQLMSLWMGVMFVSSALSHIYIKVNKQQVMFFFDLLHLALVVFSIYLSKMWYDDYDTSLWWFTFAQIIYYVLAIVAAYIFIAQYKPKTIDV